MRPPRIYCPTTAAIEPGVEIDLPPGAARHVAQVLRLRADEQIIVFDGNGAEWECRLIKVAKAKARITVGSLHETTTESPLPVAVWHGICRGARMDSVVQKATELGANSIQPMFTRYGVVKLDAERGRKRLEHWRNIAISAAEQSGRCRIPELMQPASLETLMSNSPANSTKIIFDSGGEEDLKEVLDANIPVVACTGPEGGFSAAELDLAASAGFHKVALGPRVLRTETAPVVALSLIQHLIGDLRSANHRL